MPRTKKPAKKKRSLLSRVRGAKGVGRARPTTLAIDVGGSHVKASVLDERGRMLHDRVRVDTPKRLTPQKLVSLIGELVATLPRFDRVSVGFPGVVRGGVVRTAPNLGTERFHGFNLARAIEKRLGKTLPGGKDAGGQGIAGGEGERGEKGVNPRTRLWSSDFVAGRVGS